MKLVLARYKAKPERALENQRLIEQVFQELREKSPPGLRYVNLKSDDGNFVHFYLEEAGATPVSALAAFKAFQDGIQERCLEQPRVDNLGEIIVVGSYRMFGG